MAYLLVAFYRSGVRSPTRTNLIYDPSNNSMTLTPRGKLTAAKPEELIVNGALLTDMLGREIDGDGDGQPGGDSIAAMRRTMPTTGGLPLARTQAAGEHRGRGRSRARGELTGETVPFHHNDPFDRLIVATSLVEKMGLVSPDVVLDAYGPTRLW
jgi:hypothetical protein